MDKAKIITNGNVNLENINTISGEIKKFVDANGLKTGLHGFLVGLYVKHLTETEAEITRLKELSGAQKEYIDLLGKELDEVVSVVSYRGWKSSRFEAGKELREKISNLSNGK